eukprot:CAMPEP_0117668110 /NCGR_PEP_ID=MMETSP0804-20121206/11348_1 /TAXON_ID=1074897 /ORGANISM="Tetraselmis astigmatica, Strain CCMP880" /LENGTH=75 /DNA_ID=CAMNT_0005475927 /DNA_START=204 /DNA_END=431 /DNA_ORIENTATION=-
MEEQSGETVRAARGKPTIRKPNSGTTFVATLLKLRARLAPCREDHQHVDGHPIGTLSRIFTTWMAYMDSSLMQNS